MNDCPSVYELTITPLHEDVRLREHLANCARCTALLAAWSGDVTNSELDDIPTAAAVTFPLIENNPDAAPMPGTVHAVVVGGADRAMLGVVIDIDDEEATLLPVSAETRQAGDSDVLLDAEVLGYPAHVEVWNHVRVLREQVAERVARLDSALAAALDLALDVTLDGAALPITLPVGPTITSDDDPRHAFRAAEARRVRPYEEPWRRLETGETLGAVVRARRVEREETLDLIADHTELDMRLVSALETDELDLFADMPIPALGRLVRDLELPAGRRLFTLVEHAVFNNDRTPLAGQTATFARRRRGERSRGAPPSEEVRRDHARGYATRLAEHLEK